MKRIKIIFVCSIIAVLLCACLLCLYISTSTGMQVEGSHAQTDETKVQTVEIQLMEQPATQMEYTLTKESKLMEVLQDQTSFMSWTMM